MSTNAKKILRTSLFAGLSAIAIAATVALVLLIIGQFAPISDSAHIRWGEHSTSLSGVFSGSVTSFLLAWGIVTLGVLVAVAAIAFALVITLFALVVTAAAMAASTLLVSLPLLIIGGLVFWLVRRNKSATTLASPASPG